MRYWVESGADPKKLMMGMPMYGQSFTLASPSNTGLNSPSTGGGNKGEFTRAKGFLAYNEVRTTYNTPSKRKHFLYRDEDLCLNPQFELLSEARKYSSNLGVRKRLQFSK